MDTLTVTKTLNESLKFEKQFELLERAQIQLNAVKHFYRKHDRKLQELDSQTCIYFPAIKRKTKHQAEIALMAYNRMCKSYRRTINELAHNKI